MENKSIKNIPYVRIIKDIYEFDDLLEFNINHQIRREILQNNATFVKLDVIKKEETNIFILHFIRPMKLKVLRQYVNEKVLD